MKRYRIKFTEEAMRNIHASFEWGSKYWGHNEAVKWYGSLKRQIKNTLTSIPHGLPLAPDSEELGMEIRQLVSGRYRILFRVEKQTVWILHVVGPYVERDSGNAEGDD